MMNLKESAEQWACTLANEVFNSKAVMDCELSDKAMIALTESLMDAVLKHIGSVIRL